MIKRNNKKGFTIVELVIVIAVIAILAAVLIPTFSGIIKKANISSDTALVKNLNTLAAGESAVNGGNKTAYDAISVALNNGYSIENLTPTTNNYDILWDSKADRFVLVDENGAEVYPKDGNTSTNKLDLFKIYEEVPAPADQTYSIYLRNGFNASTVDVKVGFDAGENRKVNVNYTGSDAQEVIIRTNGGELTVNAPNDTVNHYGEAAVVTIEAVAADSYHTSAKIQSLIVKSGRVVIESSANVAVIDASQATAAVKIEVAKTDAVANIITEGNANVTLDNNAKAAALTKKEVATFDELQAALDAGEKYIVLTADIETTKAVFISKDVILDGGNKTITNNATNDNDKRAIRINANNVNATIKNLTVAAPGKGAYNPGRGIQVDSGKTGVTLHIDNCKVSANDYAINICSNTSVELLVTNTEASAYGALNLWGNSYNVTIMGCKLVGINNSTGDSSNFAVMQINSNTTLANQVYTICSNISVEISDTIIEAVANNTCKQFYACIDTEAVGNTISFANCEFKTSGDQAANAGGYSIGGTDNAIYVDGVAQTSASAE